MWGHRVDGKPLYFLLNFAVNLRLLFKKVYEDLKNNI